MMTNFIPSEEHVMIVFTDLGRLMVIFFLCFFLIGYIHGNALMFMIAFFCLAIILFATVLAKLGLRKLRCRREVPGSIVFSGDPYDTKIVLTEDKGSWRLLEVLDQYTNLITNHTTNRRMTLLVEGAARNVAIIAGARQLLTPQASGRRIGEIRDVMHFPKRGHYRLGPLQISSYDPFGLVYAQKNLTDTQEVIVYPRPLPTPELVLGGTGGQQRVEVRAAARAGETADFHGIRPYVQGDDLRRVHWKSTAHTGKLAVKEYEYHSSGAVQVILDLQEGAYLGGQDFSALETSITLASSLLNYVFTAGNKAGLFTTGKTVNSLLPESGQRQLHRALEVLALAKDDGPTPLAHVLASGEGTRSGRCTTIVITPTVDMSIIGPLLSLRGRSTQVLLVLVNPRSYQDAQQEKERAEQSRWSFATRPINLKQGLQSLTATRTILPTDEEHYQLRNAAIAAGIEVYSVQANIPLHQALQGIRSRI